LFVKRIIETDDKVHHKSVVAINVNFRGVVLMVIPKAVMVWGCNVTHGCPSWLAQALQTLRNTARAVFFFSWGNVSKITIISVLLK